MTFAMNYLAGLDVAVVRKKPDVRRKSGLQDLRRVEGWFAVKEKSPSWTAMCWSIEQKIVVSLLDQVVPITEIVIRDRLTDIQCPPSRIWILMMDE